MAENKQIDVVRAEGGHALVGMGPEALRVGVEGLGLPEERAGQVAGLREIVQAARSVDGTERYLVRMADGETVETVWMPDGDGGERGDGSGAAGEEEVSEGLEGNASEFETQSRRDMRNVGALEQAGYRRATICISSQVGCAVN